MNNQHETLRGWGSIPAILAAQNKPVECKRRPWTTTEIKLLRDGWPNLETLKKVLHGRTQQAIRQRALKEGLEPRGTKMWAPAEVQLLEDVYPRSGIKECVKQLPGRTEAAIRSKVDSMGLRLLS